MRFVAIALALGLAACAPMAVQTAAKPELGFQGPRLDGETFVSFDGARLGLTTWEADGGEPWAVIVGVHGMNDYANAFHMAAPWWASQGITTIAYDQRGFGRSPERGIWGGDEIMAEDLRTITALARKKYPNAILAVAGESMGGAVTISAFASDRPPDADRVILLAPAVWGWSSQPLPNKTLLWFAAKVSGSTVYTPPRRLLRNLSPTDNRQERYAMALDPLMVWGARSDTIYALVRLMERASASLGDIGPPVLYLYGANDQVIPKEATARAVPQLKAKDRSAYYVKGWHLLTRDMEGPVVWEDIRAFLRDPQAELPSHAPTLPSVMPDGP